MKKALIAVVLAILTSGLLAPFVNANRFRGQIQNALETALDRHVSIAPGGKIHFNVFTGPGFTVDDVLIDEAPGMGVEPFAHVESLQARVRFTSLWTGHLAFSNLKLVEPSINFAKVGGGAWNVQPLMNRVAAANDLPEIQIRSGRLNFKFDNTKSVFYISNADLDVYTNERNDLVIRFSGDPARTDHAAQGLGRLVARGVLRPKHTEDEISMSVQLERTAIPELARIFDVQDSGVRGYIASNLKLDGPLSKINLSGDLRIEDIHRWDLMPNKGEGWTLNYTGFLNVPAQKLDIETRSGDQQGSPINGRFLASNYLTAPKWQASLSFHDLPAAGLVDTARHMGAPFPAGATLDAKLNGDISYARPEGVKGELLLTDAAFKFPQGGATEFAAAPLQIANNDLRLGPAEIRFEDDQTAQLEAHYSLDSRSFTLGLETKLLSIAQTKALIGRLLGTGSVPFLENCRQGAWKGSLAFERKEDGAGSWTGEFELQGTQIEVPGLAAPLRLASATVQLQPGLVALNRMRGHVGPVALEGDYRFYTAGERADRMRLSIPELQISQLEKLLLPTLGRRQGFLERALRLEPARVPDWLKARDLEGTVQIKRLRAGDTELGSVRGHLAWNGVNVQITDLGTKLDEMSGDGRLVVNLTGSAPQYRLTGQLRGVEYKSGTLELDGALETNGIGVDVALNARSDGTFSGTGIALAPDTQVDGISGDYHLEGAATGPRLLLSKVQVTQGPDVLHGQGATQPDGHVVLELTMGRKQVRLTGMLLPMRAPAP